MIVINETDSPSAVAAKLINARVPEDRPFARLFLSLLGQENPTRRVFGRNDLRAIAAHLLAEESIAFEDPIEGTNLGTEKEEE
ncbi:MAG: hypothetical protein ACOX8R_02545 [Bacillota bacterium]|jgi:hypothetical protein